MSSTNSAPRRVDGIGIAQALIGARIGLGQIVHLVDIVDAVERAGQAEPVEHLVGIGRVGVGENQLAPRQPGDRLDQYRRRGDDRDVDVMDVAEKFVRIDPVLGHQAAQRRAVRMEESLLDPVRRGRIEPQQPRHERPHPHVDLGEQVGLRRIQRVVEVEDPGVDMGERVRHERSLAVRRAVGNDVVTLPRRPALP